MAAPRLISTGRHKHVAVHPDSGRGEIDTVLFDLDDTLYPLSAGIASACRQNIEDYMAEELNVPASEVPELCGRLYREHGTTMAGLQAEGYQLDFDHWHAFVHGRIAYEATLRADSQLRNMLLSMPQQRWVFTNADITHAKRCLRLLGIEDCFQGIICFETVMAYQPSKEQGTSSGAACVATKVKVQSSEGSATDTVGKCQEVKEGAVTKIICKPQPEAFRRALEMAGAVPERTLFLDDSVRNIAAGKKAGLHTILVGHGEKCEGADLAIESIHNLRSAVPELWGAEEKETFHDWYSVSPPESPVFRAQMVAA